MIPSISQRPDLTATATITVVEMLRPPSRTFSWSSGFRKLVTRYERRAEIHYALTLIGCTLICFNLLQGRF